VGYVSKETGLDHLLEAVDEVMRGRVYVSQKMVDRVLNQVAKGEPPTEQPRLSRLSDREMEVYRMLGQGMGTRDIAKALHLSTKTIETYREHIKQKLHLPSSNAMICHAAQWAAEQV
jgi:DNA-binding NarL/FixJ family response regulator